MSKGIVPAARQLLFEIPDGVFVNIDIAQCLSILNRRLYRQGMMYYIEKIEVVSGAATIAAWKAIPDTWITQNAWKKGYSCWIEQQREYAKQCGESGQSDPRGKWADFKVHPDDAGLNYATPLDSNGDAYLVGEWRYSNFVYDDAGTSRSPAIHMIGSTVDDSAIGLIQSYGDSRNYVIGTPSNPASIATGFYAQFHGVGDIDDEIMTDIRDDNDLPPYDNDEYPGGSTNGDHLVIMAKAATTSVVPHQVMAGGMAPCGLMQLYGDTDNGSAAAFIVHIAPGPYKGVMASKMGQ